MKRLYDPASVEAKWQERWEEAKVFEIDLKRAGRPFYTHVMFPYPSGDTLHVGHWYNFGPADSYARFKKMQGYDVFSPMGFDAFGLPAENYAVQSGVPPQKSIPQNVETMIRQLKRIGCMYDWNRMVNTSHPEYYQWTQWLFIQMFKHGLAFKKESSVNFCPKCQTVLANEQVWDGKCERCDAEIVIRPMEQWFWKITDYAQRLLDDLDDLDWPEKTKSMQRNWIGRSEGVFIRSRIKGFSHEFDVWDSVPQTFMAQTFSVIAPDHPMLPEIVKGLPQEREVLAFAERIVKKKMVKRFSVDEDMEGIFTGRSIEDPFGTGDLPLWVASFVVMEYGSGIVHCSAHDERDFAFAKKYSLPLRPAMFPEDPQEAERVRNLEYCYAKAEDAILEQPEEFRGRRWGEVRSDIIKHMEKKVFGKGGINYRLRDWSIGRQRYWGAPIPIVYDPEGNPHAIPEKHLPWLLPQDVEFKPKGTAPLAQSKELKARTEKIFGKSWTPEVDTMDTFVCSSFYSFMYLGASHERGKYKQKDVTKGVLVDPAVEKKWMPVSMYIGGAEHACMHLIYARFVTMALKDFGFVKISDPFKKLVHQGVITHKGAKMSKSKGNVVSPDGFIERYGSDVFRMYLMFMGPYTEGGDWSDTGIKGVDRFVQRVWKVLATQAPSSKLQAPSIVRSKLHRAIKKVTEDIDALHFNTAISALMELLNELETLEMIPVDVARTFTILLAPLAPHLAEELWELTGGSGFVIEQPWPIYDSKYLVTDTVTIAIQVNGKVRGQIEVATGVSEKEVLAAAKSQENVKRHIEGKTLKKEMYVQGRLVSLVV